MEDSKRQESDMVLRQLRGDDAPAGWHAHSLPAWAGGCMPAQAGRLWACSRPGEQHAQANSRPPRRAGSGHATLVTNAAHCAQRRLSAGQINSLPQDPEGGSHAWPSWAMMVDAACGPQDPAG